MTPRRTLAMLALLGLAGCEGARPGATSILDIIRNEAPPAELAAMALDPYDANRRYLGTIGLASAPFAREPLYLKLFVDNAADADPLVRQAAMRGLAIHGRPEHVPLLLKGLNDAEVEVRLEAARGLQRIHDPAAVSPLLAAAREPEPDRERALLVAARAAESSPPAAKADAIKPETQSEANPNAKPDATKPDKAKDPVRSAAEDDARVRAEAAHALGQYAEPRVVQGLVAALDDSDLAVNRSALAALRTLTGQDFGLDRPAWLAWIRAQADAKADPFRARSAYLYPVFNRARRVYEYIPFVPPPPNEVTSTPAGLPRS